MTNAISTHYKLYTLICVVLLFLGACIFPKNIFASCPPNNSAATYVDGGQCYAATGLGFDTVGATYICGPVDCPGSGGGNPGNTCIYYDPSYGKCFAGYGGQGFNPSGQEPSCRYNPKDYGNAIACPPSYKVEAIIKDGSGNPIKSGITLHVYNNGTEADISPDPSTGIFTVTSWSGNHIKLTPNANSTYTSFSPSIYQGYVDQPDSLACGTEVGTAGGGGAPSGNIPNGPCVFTTTTATPPTAIPTAIPTAVPSTITLNMIAELQGIGIHGTTPLLQHRYVSVEMYDGSIANPGGPGSPSPLAVQSGDNLLYDNAEDNNSGYFTGRVTFPTPANPPSSYKFLIKIPQYLYRLAVNPSPADSNNPNVFSIPSTPGNTTVNPQTLVFFPGDIATDNGHANSISIDDYTALLTCFSAHDISSASCPKTQQDGITYADLDNNGKVDIVDFNIWLRSFFQLQQKSPSMCTDGACQGE